MNKDKNILCSHLPKPSLILVCDFPIFNKMNWFILFGRATFQMNCVQLAPYFKTYTYKQNLMRDRCTDTEKKKSAKLFFTPDIKNNSVYLEKTWEIKTLFFLIDVSSQIVFGKQISKEMINSSFKRIYL